MEAQTKATQHHPEMEAGFQAWLASEGSKARLGISLGLTESALRFCYYGGVLHGLELAAQRFERRVERLEAQS